MRLRMRKAARSSLVGWARTACKKRGRNWVACSPSWSSSVGGSRQSTTSMPSSLAACSTFWRGSSPRTKSTASPWPSPKTAAGMGRRTPEPSAVRASAATAPRCFTQANPLSAASTIARVERPWASATKPMPQESSSGRMLSGYLRAEEQGVFAAVTVRGASSSKERHCPRPRGLFRLHRIGVGPSGPLGGMHDDHPPETVGYLSVLAVLGGEQFPAPFVVVGERGVAVDPDPPHRFPVVVVVVDEEGDAGVALDVAEALEVGRGLGLGVDGRVDDPVVGVDGEADGNEVGVVGRRDRRQAGDARLVEPALCLPFRSEG